MTNVKCERCGRRFVNNNWLRSHEFEHEQEDQARLDKDWEEEQNAVPPPDPEWKEPKDA